MNPRLYLVGICLVGILVLMGLGTVDPDKGMYFIGGSLLGLPGPKRKDSDGGEK